MEERLIVSSDDIRDCVSCGLPKVLKISSFRKCDDCRKKFSESVRQAVKKWSRTLEILKEYDEQR